MRLIHNGAKVIAVIESVGVTSTPHTLVELASVSACKDEAARLGLTVDDGFDWPRDANEPIRAQIASLEQAQLLPRATREFMLLSMQSMFTAEQLALNPGYSAVKAFDDSITALRVQL